MSLELGKKWIEGKYPNIVMVRPQKEMGLGTVIGSKNGYHVNVQGNMPISVIAKDNNFHTTMIYGPMIEQAVKMEKSLIISDEMSVGRELYLHGADLIRAGYQVKVMSLGRSRKVTKIISQIEDETGEKIQEVGFNCLAHLDPNNGRNNDITAVLQMDRNLNVWEFAKDVYGEVDGSEAFANGAKYIIGALTMYILRSKAYENKYKTFRTLMDLLQLPPETILKKVQEIPSEKEIESNYVEQVRNMSPSLMADMLKHACEKTACFKVEERKELLSDRSFSFAKLKDEKIALFIETVIEDDEGKRLQSDSTDKYIGFVLNRILREILAAGFQAKTQKHDILVFWDMSNPMNGIDDLEKRLCDKMCDLNAIQFVVRADTIQDLEKASHNPYGMCMKSSVCLCYGLKTFLEREMNKETNRLTKFQIEHLKRKSHQYSVYAYFQHITKPLMLESIWIP